MQMCFSSESVLTSGFKEKIVLSNSWIKYSTSCMSLHSSCLSHPPLPWWFCYTLVIVLSELRNQEQLCFAFLSLLPSLSRSLNKRGEIRDDNFLYLLYDVGFGVVLEPQSRCVETLFVFWLEQFPISTACKKLLVNIIY